jgi:hypothetical protein
MKVNPSRVEALDAELSVLLSATQDKITYMDLRCVWFLDAAK